MTISRFTLEGKVAIVTGGSQGIGKAISLAFAEAGARVVIADVRPDIGEEVAAQIKATGKKAAVVPVDVTKNEQVVKMVDRVVKELGRIDILVNNAGGASGEGFGMGRVLKISEHDWDETIALNLKSVFLCSRAVAPVMLEQKKGNIINMASITAGIPFPGMAAYAAAKAGVVNLTKSLAMELAPHIRVNAIAPGSIDTPRTIKTRTPEQLKHVLSNIPLGRAGLAEDVASLAIYLASDAAIWVTGSTMDVNGGQILLAEWGQPYFRD